MAAVGTADVVYTLQGGTQSFTADSKLQSVYKLVFGAGLTYPTGGIPLSKAKLSAPNQIVALELIDPGSGNGYHYKFNYTGATIQIYQMNSHNHSMLIVGGAATITTNTLQLATAVQGLQMQLAGTGTIAGVAAGSTVGGILPQTLASLDELGTAATVGTTTLYVRVTGW